MTRVKVCCIADHHELRTAVRHGASALGLVSAMPSGPGVIDEATITGLVPHIPPGVAGFLLTSLTDTESLIAQQRRLAADTLQLVDWVGRDVLSNLREALPGIKLVQVIHVVDDAALDQAREIADLVHAVLLDSGNPNLAVKELGGTGRVHNWQISRRIVDTIDKPVFLAGGLRPENVAAAIRAVRPFGLDLCSGIRTEGKLDETKLHAFMAQVREADQGGS